MSKVIAVANQKGGVGKTTTCVNLAAALSLLHQTVLLIDLDPQANATVSCGLEVGEEKTGSMNDVLLEKKTFGAVIRKCAGGFDIAPAHQDLTEAETVLLRQSLREFRLMSTLRPYRSGYNYILIDCPPSLNILTVNALSAANSVLITLQCEYFALEGLTSLLNTIEKIRFSSNRHLALEGILRTLFDSRTALAHEVSAQLIEHFKSDVYETVIPRNVTLAEAPSHGLPGVLYDGRSAGAVAYMTLAKEIVHKHATSTRKAP